MLAWHARALGTPLNSSEHLSSLRGIPCTCCRHSDLSISYEAGKPHKEWGLSPAALGSTRGHKPGLGAGFCSLCQNLLSMEYIPQHHSDSLPSHAKAPWQLLSAPLSGNFIVTLLPLGCSHCACSEQLFPPCLLHCHSSASWERLCALSFPGFLFRMTFSQPPPFPSIFKPDSYFRLISV